MVRAALSAVSSLISILPVKRVPTAVIIGAIIAVIPSMVIASMVIRTIISTMIVMPVIAAIIIRLFEKRRVLGTKIS
jgi:hypothetical protein